MIDYTRIFGQIGDMTMCDLSLLSDTTYALQHNPNCASPYLIRLIGKHRGALDLLPYSDLIGATETKDILCFGKTLTEAVEKARTTKSV